jgi:hypothetical protein
MVDRRAAPEGQKEVTFELKVPSGDRPAPEAANFFHLTFSGPDVQMFVGYVDLYEVHLRAEQIRQGRKPSALHPEITHRLALGLRGFLALKQQVDDLFGKMTASGMIGVEAEPK